MMSTTRRGRHDPDSSSRALTIDVGPTALAGDLVVPDGARGIVLFAHGSGSSRHSPRNRLVARLLQRANFATLLLDLLSAEEEASDAQDGRLRFAIPFLTGRLARASEWLAQDSATCHLPLGLFGASTGAAAALMVAADRPHLVCAVVSRGGRVDLAEGAFGTVEAPTMLIVGGDDREVLELNRLAISQLHCEKELVVVEGASHLFEEPGALEQVATLAIGWFTRHLNRPDASLR